MNRLATATLLAVATSAALAGAATPAHADTEITYNPGPGNSDWNCSRTTVSIQQDGPGIFLSGYAYGAAWDGGTCNGAFAPKNYIAIEPTLTVWPVVNGLLAPGPTTCKWGGNWVGFAYNTVDLFGAYFAMIPGTGLGAYFSPEELCGSGYYQLDVQTFIYGPGGGTMVWEPGADLSTGWVKMTIGP